MKTTATETASLGLVPILLACLSVVALSACAPSGLEARRADARAVAADAGWRRVSIDAGAFTLIAHQARTVWPARTLSVYLEGDGLAWLNRAQPSFDPTPLDPVALHLALRQPSGTTVHLSRPCQFTLGAERRNCSNKYWTSHRFAPEVVDAMSTAIDQLKAAHSAQGIELIGYSGGGAIAALLAARRGDVVRLITVAGNLDHAAWTRLHRISPLSASLNAADAAPALAHMRQVHFVGAKDREVPPELAQSWIQRLHPNTSATLRVVPGFDHSCCWAEAWPTLYPTPAAPAP